ncbi:MAG: O-antigen ligase family protein, partial [Patescibacteria group bacterium]
MKKYIEQSVRIILYISFFVPLIVLPTSYIFPFIVPKIILLRSLVTLALGGYISLLFINWREYKPKATLINIALLLFLLSFATSTFLGVDPYHSFWDNHERMLGLFTILHYVAYYFVAGAVFKNSKDWQWALRIFLLAASLVMFIAVLQRMVDPMLLLNNGSTRVSSTLGNAIYLGGYGLFLSFAAYLAWVREKNSIWKFAIVLFGALGMLGLFFSDTRGSILGFIVGVVIAVLIYSLLLKSYPRTRYFLWSLLGILILVVGTLYVSRQTNFVKNLPAVGRAVNTSFIDIKTSPRWIAWEIAVESWKQKPIFGWGPNNYFYAFNKNYNPRSLEYGYGETWFDNAHNIILNTLAVQGLFGLLAYLALFAAPVYVLLKLYKEDDKKMNNIHLLAVGTAFLGAHLVQNVTVFENITSYLYFVFWLALINGAISGKEFKEGLIPDKKFNFGLSFSVILICALVVFVFNVQPARANKKTLVAIREINSSPAQSLEHAKQALGFSSPHIDDIRSDLGRSALAILATENSNFSKEKRTAVFKLI